MKKRILYLALIAAIVISVTACGGEKTETKAGQESDTVTGETTGTAGETSASAGKTTALASDDPLVADSEKEIDGNLEIHVGDHSSDYFIWKVAQAKGFFDEEFPEDNINVVVDTFSGGPAVMEAMTSGDLQFGIGGIDPVVNYAASGSNLEIVAEIGTGYHALQIVVQKGSDIKTLEDLNGHSVAVTIGTSRHNFLVTALNTVGLTTEEVPILNLTNADIITAIQAGEAEAAVVTASNFAAIQDYVDVLVYADDYLTNYNVLAINKAFGEKYPATTARVVRLAKNVTEWIAENREEALDIFVEATGAERASAEKAYDTMVFTCSLEKDDMAAALDHTVEFALDNDIITNPIKGEDLLNDSYIKRAEGK